MEYTIASKFNYAIDVYANTLNPTQIINATAEVDNDDKNIVTSNCTQEASNVFKSTNTRQSIAEMAS